MTRAFAVALGSNLGERMQNLRNAAEILMGDGRVRLPRLAGVYGSDPAEGVGGGGFLNTAILGLWTSGSHDLLQLCRGIEKAAGSPVEKRKAARIIDVDILYLGEEVSLDRDLILPHPGIARRAFVLAPLKDLLGSRPIPPMGRSPAELLAQLPGSGDITLVVPPPAPGEIWSGA